MTEASQAPAVVPEKKALTVVDDGEFSMLLDSGKFGQLQRIGTMYARSKMVPAHFQGDEPSCMVAVQMAMRLGIDPFMFLQKTYVVGGKPGMEAPLVIALINTRGPFKGPIDWDLKRDDKGDVIECTAYATHRETGKVCSSTITWKMVEAEGWSKKNGSKWLTLREQMFKYRSAAFLGRLYCPEVLMGMGTVDELHDSVEVDVTPAPAPDKPAKRTLKEKMGAAPVADAEVVVEPAHQDPIQPSQEAAGAAREPEPTQPPPEAEKAPAIPFDDLLKYAKRAKDKGQADVVRDAMKEGTYSEAEQQQVNDILNSKTFASE